MAANQQAANQNDNSLDFLWLVVIIVAAVALIWFFGRSYIAIGVFQVRYYEIIGINSVLGAWGKLVQLLHLPFALPDTQSLNQWFSYIQSKPGAVPFNTLADISAAVGKYLRIPVAIILALCAMQVYRANLQTKFQKIFSMVRLKKQEVKDWPQIAPVVNLDLVKQDINIGPWAMAMTPMEFAKNNNLLKIEKDVNGKVIAGLQLGAAHRVFSLQLGPVWNNGNKLPIHIQALFAIFAARVNRDRAPSDKLLNQISASANSGKLDFTGTQELLKSHYDSKLVRRVIGSHAYVLTVMASLLELGRTDGVLASAEFLWLKPLDRKLWYMLNSVGRQTAVPEVAGPFAHWLAERKIGRPLKVPMVDQAVKSLNLALQEVVYEPEDE
jgi:intracellular multiplication protein IcmP